MTSAPDRDYFVTAPYAGHRTPMLRVRLFLNDGLGMTSETLGKIFLSLQR